MKKKTIALVTGIVGSGVSGSLILGQILNIGLLSIGSVIFAGLTTAAVLTGFGLLAVSALLIGIGCYQLWKRRVKKQDASNESLLNEFSPKSTREYILHRLPESVLKYNVAKYLGDTDLEAFASSNKAMRSFLQPQRMLSPLLRSVVNGNQERVIQILTKYPDLVVRRGCVRDNSGRFFPEASAAELVRWCGDLRYMANAMLDVLQHLPNQELAEQIRIKWVEQNASYEQADGLVCVLPGRTEPENPSLAFSLAPLLGELKAYVDNFDRVSPPQRKAQWCTKVGAEQFLLPAIYLQHYCNPEVPFYPKPSFDEPTFPRVLEIYNQYTGARQGVWDGRDGGSLLGDGGSLLGRDFGILRAQDVANWAKQVGGWSTARDDLVALGACKARTQLDLDLFMRRLGKPLNQQLVVELKSSHYPGS